MIYIVLIHIAPKVPCSLTLCPATDDGAAGQVSGSCMVPTKITAHDVHCYSQSTHVDGYSPAGVFATAISSMAVRCKFRRPDQVSAMHMRFTQQNPPARRNGRVGWPTQGCWRDALQSAPSHAANGCRARVHDRLLQSALGPRARI